MKVAQHEGQCELKVPSVEGGGLLSSTDASIRKEATSSILCREQSVVVFEKERSPLKHQFLIYELQRDSLSGLSELRKEKKRHILLTTAPE